jgi:GNAT superfamily N-acetyltransferase
MERSPIAVLPMRADQRDAAAGVFARAFQTDPAMIAAFPDPAQRAHVMRPLGDWNIRLGELFGTVLVAGDPLAGVLTWFSSEREEELEAKIEETYGSMPDDLGPEAWAHNEAMGPLWETPHEALKAAVGEQHWYVDLVAVDPKSQGQGIGGALLRAVNQRADAEAMPCALFTFTERNVSLYQRHGYEIVCKGIAAIVPLIYWGMKRPAMETATGSP